MNIRSGFLISTAANEIGDLFKKYCHTTSGKKSTEKEPVWDSSSARQSPKLTAAKSRPRSLKTLLKV
jgi:hypothetical protein